jgi:hypothetical protein
MQISRTALTFAALALSAALGSCANEATAPPSTSGAIQVALDMIGDTPNLNLAVGVDGGATRTIAAGASVVFGHLEPATHVVALVGIGSACALSGDNPLQVRAVAGDTAKVGFQVTCGRATPDFNMAGMEILGSGYNIGGNYADVADVRARILDLAALERDGLLRQVQYEWASYHDVSGATSSEYLSNLQVSVNVSGKGFGFSGALKTSFSQDRYTSSQYSFATVQSLIRKYGLRVALDVTPGQLRAYLTPGASAAINDPNVDPLDLFATFGTHLLKGIIVGGRLDFTTSANMSFEHSGRSIDVYARASFKSMFASAAIETDVIDQQSQSEFAATQQQHVEVYGGRSEYGQDIVNQGSYENWIESVRDNPVFMDFESTGLIGIWELASDSVRRAAIQTAFNTYAVANGISLVAAGMIVSNFSDDNEGWTIEHSDATIEAATFQRLGGYLGGFIVGDDPGALRFSAPAQFLGNQTPFANGTLEYYLWYSPDPFDLTNGTPAWQASIPEFADIVSENGNLTYEPANSDHVPDPAFRPGNYDQSPPKLFVINLKAGEQDGSDGTVPGRWYRWDGQPASDADIWLSMANVRAIRIWGDYVVGTDSLALDKVALKVAQTAP